MKTNLTNKSSKQAKQLRFDRGFALIATISILSLILIISLALLSLATTQTKVSGYSNHLNIAKSNARLALQVAISQLQKYTGPDQRVTARADITGEDWSDPLTPQVANPYYHLAWDVSGSEIDYTANLQGYHNNHRWGYQRFPLSFGTGGAILEAGDFGTALGQSDYHRPGMDPGHDFKGKLPAVLVSGNEFFDLTNGTTGDYNTSVYPTGYITADTSLSGIPRVEIIPSESIMVSGSLASGATSNVGVEVPIVDIEGSTNGSRYAFWIGDESLKARINLESELAKEASKVAQRSPILKTYQTNVADDGVTKEDIRKRLTLSSLELNSSSSRTVFNYSPDLTTAAESLVIDVRNGGFKKDFTFSLYNPDTLSPLELRDNSIPLDIVRLSSGDLKYWTAYWSPGQGLLPMIEKWRNLANEPVVKDVAVNPWTDTRGLYPLMSQVQMAQHVAFSEEVDSSGDPAFSVHMGVFPSVTLWNPYNVPLELTRNFTVALVRRELTADQSRNKVRTDYSLQKADGSVVEVDVVWPSGGTRTDELWSGWWMSATIRLEGRATPVIIPPGETMVFSPEALTRDDVAMNSSYYKAVNVDLVPGWNPGQGVLLRMDDKKHLLADFGGVLPKARLVQPAIKDNLAWVLSGEGKAGSRYLYFNEATHRVSGVGYVPHPVRCSLWTRLDAVAQDTSSFVTVPSTSDARQDASGAFPGLLVKHGLRMGDDYLLTPDSAIKPSQTELGFPYVANYNPAALAHAGYADANLAGKTGEALDISPSLMGGVYDYQTANEIYPVSTKAGSNSTPIGVGYLNGDRMILMNRPFALASTVVNGESASITSFSQLNGSQFLKGQRQDVSVGTSSLFGSLSSSNIPAFPIGNSIANPKLDVHHDDVRTSANTPRFDNTSFFGGIGKMYASATAHQYDVYSMELDYSYILNDHLYDHYFFSTIPQSNYDTNEPLVNSRLLPSDESKQDYIDNPITGASSINKLKSIDSAQHLSLIGGFNVNSTSVPAWEMLLSSSLGTKREGISDTASASTVSFSNKEATEGAVVSENITEEQALDSNFDMALTQSEIRNLAEAMVSEVKRRGPFPSLSAFVNRANFLRDIARSNPNEFIGSDGIIDARYSGAIQSALDRIGANENLDTSRTLDKTGFVEQVTEGWVYPARDAFRKSVNSHLPGYLKQSDVLAQIAPVITVRGDTFTVRCFGSSGEDSNGNPIAKVVCEAVVQRTKEFVDPTNTFDTSVKTAVTGTIGATTTLTAVNQRLGRKYKVVSFKWLSQTEVAKMNISDL